ncbi:MAG: EscN/YscN/HrcN family type III secretion system ATPase, partial [Limnobacter sp.]
MSQFLEKYKQNLSARLPVKKIGFVREIVVSTVKAVLPQVTQGELCEIETIYGKPILAEVIAFSGNMATLTCLESVEGVHLGAKVTQLGKPHSVKAREEIFSAVMDGMGRNMEYPTDSLKGALSFDEDATPVLRSAPLALHRPPVSEKLITGVRVIDGLMTLGKGQRLGIFSPPGCGKSTLLAQIARGADVDTIVFALVGERGRELREFMENEITPDIRAKSIFVCATSDKAAIERVRAAFTAVSVAEYLRDQG